MEEQDIKYMIGRIEYINILVLKTHINIVV